MAAGTASARQRIDELQAPLVNPGETDETLSLSMLQFQLKPAPRGWWLMLMLGLSGVGLLGIAVSVTLYQGIGAWGNNISVGWAFGITNFVWWIGIGHAGTLISAILLVFQQKWRNSINRFAEAMTLFAVMCAGVFPVLHVGRPWLAYWLFPYPSTMVIWPNFKSPLMWDVFAVSTYFTVSLLFWFLGLLPDLATIRDVSKSRTRRILYGIASLGWRGSARHWHDYKMAYMLLGGLATPLVLSVHTIVSFDFAVAVLPGWHATIFPPYFVAGAVFSGFAMVMTLIIPARRFMGLKHVITERHLENINKVILATGMMVAYGYLMEHFIAWYSGDQFEAFVFQDRRAGMFRYVYFLQMFCNVLVPQIFWFKKARNTIVIMWIASVLIQVGMWTERFMIVVQSLHKDFLPSSWSGYSPTWVDWSLLLGTMGFFTTAFLLFLKFVPAVALSEVKELSHELQHGGHPGAGR